MAVLGWVGVGSGGSSVVPLDQRRLATLYRTDRSVFLRDDAEEACVGEAQLSAVALVGCPARGLGPCAQGEQCKRLFHVFLVGPCRPDF